MPMYDYRCRKCGTIFEELVFSSATPDEEIACPQCHERQAERLLSAPMIAVGGSSQRSSSERAAGCNATSGFS
jgi:putative FmdB family regulatory protein